MTVTSAEVVTAGGRRGGGRWAWVAVVAVAVVAGAGLRWHQLSSWSLWFDEGYTAWVVSLTPRQIVDVIRVDTAPPLYYLMLRAWAGVAGHSEAGLRSMSALASSLALVVAVGVAGRLYRDRWAQVVAVVAVACSAMQVGYAHEARFYATMGLAGILDLYVVLRACERERASPRWLAAAVLAVAFSLWLNNILVVYLACLGVAWLVCPGRRPARGRVVDGLIVAGLAGLAFAPWLPSARAQAQAVQASFWIPRPTVSDLLGMGVELAGPERAAEHLVRHGPFVVISAVLATMIAAAAVASVAVRRWRAAAAVIAFGLVPVVLIFVYSRVGGRSLFIDRAFIVSSAVVPLLLGLPLEVAAAVGERWPGSGLPWRVVTGVGTAAAVLLALPSTINQRTGVPLHFERWREASAYAVTQAGPGRTVVFNAVEGELLYDFYARHGDFTPDAAHLTGSPHGFFDLHPPRTMQGVWGDADLQHVRDRLAERPGDPVVLIVSHETPVQGGGHRTMLLLQKRMRQTAKREFGTIEVITFVPKAGQG